MPTMPERILVNLENFQAWSSASLELGGLTVVVGPSNRGKSALARAIKAVFRNEISAENVKKGTSGATIDVRYGSNEITAQRGVKGTTSYTVNGEEFAKLGRGIPPPIEALRFGPEEVNGIKLDPVFAGQFDSQFLVGSSPAELNAVLNAFSSTEKLDAGRRTLKKEVADTDASSKALGVQISDLETTYQKLDDKATKGADIQERLQAQAAEVRRLELAISLIERIRTLWAAVQRAARDLSAVKRVEGALTTTVNTYRAIQRSNTAMVAQQLATSIQGQLVRVNAVADALKALTVAKKAHEHVLVAINATQVTTKVAEHLSMLERLDVAIDHALKPYLVLNLVTTGIARVKAITRIQTRVASVSSVAAALSLALGAYKAMVRVSAALKADPAPSRALAGKIPTIDLSQAGKLHSAGIILEKLTKVLSPKVSAILDALATCEVERAALQAEVLEAEHQLEHLRSSGVIAICPKCSHEFTHQPA